ncbi:hypothetical protein E2C01_040762 [Portunus trituberculatus]|uniref:Uncharacterized protein n=1 Tax=Portunus trituberculatus TaxID=210409 RepID=A0A5B7FP31_PORTR|nr:hypothetical protein [Portunus trituberculatus]
MVVLGRSVGVRLHSTRSQLPCQESSIATVAVPHGTSCNHPSRTARTRCSDLVHPPRLQLLHLTLLTPPLPGHTHQPPHSPDCSALPRLVLPFHALPLLSFLGFKETNGYRSKVNGVHAVNEVRRRTEEAVKGRTPDQTPVLCPRSCTQQ